MLVGDGCEVISLIFSQRIVFINYYSFVRGMKMTFANHIFLWFVLHTDHYTSLDSRTFELILWGEMQPLLLNAVTDRKSVQWEMLARWDRFRFFQTHRRGDYNFIKLNRNTFKAALL